MLGLLDFLLWLLPRHSVLALCSPSVSEVAAVRSVRLTPSCPVADIQEPRLQFAKGYAATDYFVPGKQQEGEDQVAYSRRQVSGLVKAANSSPLCTDGHNSTG